MPYDGPPEKRPEPRPEDGSPSPVSNRSRKDLKAALMRLAFDGDSRHSPAEMILLIQWRLNAMTLPPGHADILNDINLFGFDSAPRAVLMLDTLARQNEIDARAAGQPLPPRRRYEYTPPHHPAPALLQ